MEKGSLLDGLKDVLDSEKAGELIKDAGEKLKDTLKDVDVDEIKDKLKDADVEKLKDAGKELLSHLGGKKD